MSKIDFRWWGRMFLLAALLIGLYLSRYGLECFKERVDEFQLGGVVDDGGAPVVDEYGNVRENADKGRYSDNFKQGSGLFAYLGASVPYCIEEETFSQPKVAYMGFWILLGLGLVCQVLGKIFKPEWKKNIAKRAREEEDRERERQESLEAQRSARQRSATREVEAIDVGGIDLGGEGGKGLFTGNDGALSGSSHKARGRRNSAPGGLMGVSGQETDSRDQPLALDLGSEDQGEAPREAEVADEKRERLAELGIGGGDQGWLGGNEESADWLAGNDAGEDLSFGGDEQGYDLGGGLDLDDPLSAGAPAGEEAERSGFPALREAQGQGDLHLGDTDSPHSLLSGPESRPLGAIRGGGPGSGDGPGLSRSQRAPTAFVPVNRRRYWIPAGHQDDEILFVGPVDEEAELEGEAGQSEDHPLGSIQEALDRAAPLLSQGLSVQIRLLPGIYREKLELPANVSLINHSIPKGMTAEEMRFWLSEEKQGYDTRTILSLPQEAADDAWTLTLKGSNIFLAGLHVVGRGELNEDDGLSGGVFLDRCAEATVYLCHIVGHRTHHPGAALHIKDSGRDGTQRVVVQDCLMEDNATSGRGGAIWVKHSAVAFLGCGIRDNESGTAGGGIYVGPNRVPVLLDHCLVAENMVQVDGKLPRASRGGWSGEVGHGGGLFVDHGEVHIRVSDLLDNQAQGAGGAIFSRSSVLLMEGDPASLNMTGRVAGNKAQRGGGVLMSGPLADEVRQYTSALRATHVDFLANEAMESGGGLACFRLSRMEFQSCTIRQNRVSSEFGEGGGVHANLGSRIKLKDTIVEHNAAPFRGGGLSVSNSSMRLFDGCAVRENKSAQGDSGGVAFYTMTSNYLDELRDTGRLEEPMVCAVGRCEVRDNEAARGVAGLFIGNFVREQTAPITFALKSPEMIKDNLLEEQGELKRRQEQKRNRSVEFLVAWKGVVQADERRPPQGRRVLGGLEFEQTAGPGRSTA